MYAAGDYVVCPGHGVGQVFDVEVKEVGGSSISFYIVKVIANGMTIMIPLDSKDGIRVLAQNAEIEQVFCLLSDHDITVDTSTWNRRHREYLAKIKTGSLIEIADVLRSLFLLKHRKALSFGERKMLELCKELLVKEIAISQGSEELCVSGRIEECFQ
ncbi:MAG: CarD family transcriptional regulator [Bacteriovoracaceae bacterium]|jgi:CarD family transcriptional regulator|nr:CarD family transcriptional regulator [Bacteriovoracaceae bacterium]